MIPFNKPPVTGDEITYISQALTSGKLSGDAYFGKKCQAWFEDKLSCHKTLLTPSCTAALEMAAILIDITEGDEVIMPSFTFVSTANAFVLRGAKIVFVDIRPDTMNMDERLIEAAITIKTKAIVPVHYAGVSCDMDVIMDIAERHKLYVIEDAAQGMMSFYKGKPLGSIGHLAAYSFHETKNYSSGGEGGLLIINDKKLAERAEIIREKGTNRSLFFRGQVDKYTWVDIGSSFLPSEIQAAYLWAQLTNAEKIHSARMYIWNKYYAAFEGLADRIERPVIPSDCKHNAHMFYIKLRNLDERSAFIEHMKVHQITAVFHYIPLHAAPAGLSHGRLNGEDVFTTSQSERLVRLPIYYGMTEAEISKVIDTIVLFFNTSNMTMDAQ